MLLASEFQFAPSPTTPFPKLAGRFLIAVDVQLAIPGFLGAMAGADEYVSKVHTDNKITEVSGRTNTLQEPNHYAFL